jgi:hypothetical protein
MNQIRIFSILFFLIFPTGEIISQTNFRCENAVYDQNIKTVIFHRNETDFNYPVINLNTNEQLQLKFDDLSADTKSLYYTLIHCNSDWTPSNLLPIEYLKGFAENPINDYQFSFNTLIPYNHYELVFPNDDAQPILSGNYLLVVYEDNDIDKPLITRRFWIVDSKATVDAQVKQSTLVALIQTNQEITMTVNTFKEGAAERVSMYISQNGRPDYILENIRPNFVQNFQLIFNNPRILNFPGGNEFHYFNSKDHENAVEPISSIEFESPYYTFKLISHKDESYFPYSYHPDLNGERLITAERVDNPDLEADYVYVDFNLIFDKPLETGDFYVSGAFTDFRLSDETRMEYNEKTKSYSLRLLLKQGYYNYEYVFAKSINHLSDNTLTQGSHYETENNYLIFVYYRNPGNSYDELIGVQVVNSIKKL